MGAWISLPSLEPSALEASGNHLARQFEVLYATGSTLLLVVLVLLRDCTSRLLNSALEQTYADSGNKPQVI